MHVVFKKKTFWTHEWFNHQDHEASVQKSVGKKEGNKMINVMFISLI